MIKRAYIVFRIGSNGANQPMQQEIAIGVIDAKNRKDALAIADDEYGHCCYNNQRLEVRSARTVSAEVQNELIERLALEAL